MGAAVAPFRHLFRHLPGEEPGAVQAMMHRPPGDPRFKEVEATVHFLLRFPSGALAACTTSYDYHDTKRFLVLGTKATLTLDPATDYYKHQMLLRRKESGGGSEEIPIEENRQIPEKNQFALEMDHFAECVLENREPRTPGQEGLRDVRLIHAIYEAARTGKTVMLG